jgi:ArsR family transcriptional regulator
MVTAKPMVKGPTDVAQVARWCHALSDETRVRVVEILSGGEQCVCDLQATLGAGQSRLSFHLRVLREAGIVNDRKAGRWVHYSLRPDVLEELAKYLHDRKPDENAWGVCGCGDASQGDCC